MPMPVQDLPFIDYDDPAYAVDPFGWLATHARSQKLVRSFRGVDVLDYKTCRSVLLNRDLGNGHLDLVELIGFPEDSVAMGFKRRALDGLNRGDQRTHLRRIMLSHFGPAQAEQLRDTISGVIGNLIDELPTAGQVELKYAFADRVPARVFCAWINAPMNDDRLVMELSETMLRIFERDPAVQPKIVESFERTFEYVRGYITARRAAPGDDILSALIRGQQEGVLSEQELEDCMVMMVEGSSDNTSHQIAIAVDRLTRIPGLWRQMGKEPQIIPDAIAELMRLWPRSISTTRTALVDTTLEGVAIPKGMNVFASFGAAHRNNEAFEDADIFKLGRDVPVQHMNFGGGIFSCLGQFVASIETEEAIAQLSQRFPNLTVTDVDRSFSAMFHSINHINVALDG